MNKAIAIIKDEHISISSVLKGLVSHVSDARSGNREVDPHLIGAQLDYIEAYPERLHHPKEDRYLFRKLRERTAESHAILDQLEAEHVRSRALVGEMRAHLKALRETGNLEAFARSMEDYATFHYQHMRTEERLLLPMAERCLTDEDWEEITAAFESNTGQEW
ncbi:hemerythrin domain-containing protein [Rhodospirillum sp. A1_3_36]|uniref:hemerythrin domain-containing protein n=1 Tax=Rhodospirillum sp. A1_3_36 TaxID=3391666 RepID=UPI0039A59305